MEAVPFEPGRWEWGDGVPEPTTYLGRECIRVESALAMAAGLEILDGAIEVDLAMPAERGFHGVVWRARDDANYESFFVRPHQVGNPDAIQYTPVFNDVSAWQLYHGPGFWAPIAFPLDEWFRLRVVFSGSRAEAYVGDLETPALAIRELKQPVAAGRVGVLVGGPAIHLADVRVGGAEAAILRVPEPPAPPALSGIVPFWAVSDPFPESELRAAIEPGLFAARSWTRLAAEPTGLADLARVNGIRDGSDTVFARTSLHSPRAQTVELELGFSDRAVVYLNGRAFYRGDDTYRSRDYRFLGSIGWYDRLYLALDEGENELVVAVTEDFGGWGVQARIAGGGDVSFG